MAFLYQQDMTPNESALMAQMQEHGYSQGMIITALHILSKSKELSRDALLYLVEEHPSEENFISYISQAFASH